MALIKPHLNRFGISTLLYLLVLILCKSCGKDTNIYVEHHYNIHIPDKAFKQYLLNYTIDIGEIERSIDVNGDGEISDGEAGLIDHIDVDNYDIFDLTGIEEMFNLRSLSCKNNQIDSLDLSRNHNLIVLECFDNKISYLNISGCPNLKRLDCSNNKLHKIDLSGNPGLETVLCENNFLEQLDLSKNVNLGQLFIRQNEIYELDVSHNLKLNSIWFYENRLKQIDLAPLAELIGIWLGENKLEILDISNNPKVRFIRIDGVEPLLHSICISSWSLPLEEMTLVGSIDTSLFKYCD
jgi:hypothetical protein